MTLELRDTSIIKDFPKAVIFDTDNTLYPYHYSHQQASLAVQQKAEKILGIKQSRFSDALKISKREIKERLGETASSHSRLLYFQRTIELLGLKTQIMTTLDLEQTYWRTFLTNSQLFPEMHEFLHDLRAHGIQSAVVTDLTAQIQFRKLVYFGLHEAFDYIVTTEEAGADKPNPLPFQLARSKLGLEKGDNLWMIGDHPVKDIQGAKKTLGAITLQKNHKDVKVLKGKEGPDILFDKYSELRELLGKISSNKGK
ncbi:HAD family hydrolase [Shewanella woodyi]|uniref:HAD family hydrolase n=1 Tax=Shewanella woodyi TaxID=60961 RepID=UPI0007EAE51E|nr:HAD family hydrolase [Shewanella woodyi]